MLLTFVVLLLLFAATSEATHMTIEVETTRAGLPVHDRDGTSNKKTVYFKQGDTASVHFCLMRPTSVRVMSVDYTNDGDSDTVQISIGNQNIGSLSSTSHSKGGHFWNVVESSGPIGTSSMYGSGMHRLKFTVTSADSYGIELDKVVLDVDDPFLGTDSKMFTCKLPCLEDAPHVVSRAVGAVSDGKMMQKSYPTPCAEEDNIHIPVFHPSVREYSISATPPLYHSFLNQRSVDTSNCAFLQPEYWRFQNVSADQLLQYPVTSNRATFSLRNTAVGSVGTTLQFDVVFGLQGRSVGHIDSEIGCKFDLTLKGLTANADVTLMYKGRTNNYQSESAVTFTSTSFSYTWIIPDFTWTENNDNEIVISISTSQTNGIVFDTLRLQRRHVRPDKAFTIFKDEMVRIEGIDVDFWWRAPETMQLKLSPTCQTWNKVDYMRISVPVPWNDTWSQTFVMYQDGNVRLLPQPLVGTDWIPFGTSVIVGQTNPNDHRPVAPISKVTIDPDKLTMDLKYIDGGHARLKLMTLVEKTKLLVNNLCFAKDSNSHPFATFRSMYADAGNDDSDSVMTDKSGPDHVMAKWGTMSGTSFFVYRKCQSEHLTQSPDIRLDILRTN